MELEESVYEWLVADPVLAGLVADRIYPNRIPDESTPPPWLFYAVTNEEPTEGLKVSNRVSCELEFAIYARTYAEVRQIHKALKSRFHGFRGGVINQALWQGFSAIEVTGGYCGTATYQVWASESPVITQTGTLARVLAAAGAIQILPNGQDSVATFATDAITFMAPIYGDASNMTGIPTPDLTQYAKKDAANVFTPANALTLPIEIVGISGLTQPLFRIRNDVGIVVLRCNNNAGSVEVNRINATSGRWDFLGDGQCLFAAEGHLMFSSGVAIGGPWTVGIRRSAAGVIDITNGTTSGALGRLRTLGYFVRSGSANPTTSDLADGYSVVWRNTTSGEVRVWCNIGGTLLSTGALS